jgi:hypothetical protein
MIAGSAGVVLGGIRGGLREIQARNNAFADRFAKPWIITHRLQAGRVFGHHLSVLALISHRHAHVSGPLFFPT